MIRYASSESCTVGIDIQSAVTISFAVKGIVIAKENKNIHVVYLTADGTKEPTVDSLPSKIKNIINYCAVNYRDDILPWLEEDVLPNIPYGSDGMMIAGVRQYIAFLKQLLADESSKVVDNFFGGLKNENDKNKYNKLLFVIQLTHNIGQRYEDFLYLC